MGILGQQIYILYSYSGASVTDGLAVSALKKIVSLYILKVSYRVYDSEICLWERGYKGKA